jgi:hypothetical protein
VGGFEVVPEATLCFGSGTDATCFASANPTANPQHPGSVSAVVTGSRVLSSGRHANTTASTIPRRRSNSPRLSDGWRDRRSPRAKPSWCWLNPTSPPLVVFGGGP